ncbi:uncharacterized protein cubi_00635 [Cryptosporidium ubiquitum]|uniref:Uncharacterized protein n=1 Tax=Cryptosporidium ubiquitum TaxID=857276 RepID=A0A1J4MED5_9CRYT|nr:uncharacterized protein cubi_00635 [Cryptosporidium ubiquitum]OII71827.1 hypothetical protein cubi_00635 [Cryptosporidium ubiquitum]
MRKILYRLVFILWLLVLIQLISECISSGLDDKFGVDLKNNGINNERESNSKLEVPTYLIREYGYYFLNNNGFDLDSLVCESGEENLEYNYANFASRLVKATSKLLLNINLSNSVLDQLYGDIFSSVLDLEHLSSDYYYFLEIQNMYKHLRLFKDNKLIFNLEDLELEIKQSIDSMSEIISNLTEKNEQAKEEFCVNLYLIRFKGLKQVMVIVNELLSIIRGEKISKINERLDYSRFKEIFDLIVGNSEYLTSYMSIISEVNIKLEKTFLGCLDSIGNVDIPLFGGNNQDNQLLNMIPESFRASFGNDKYKRSAKYFGPALDDLVEKKTLYRMNCDLRISELKEFVKSKKIIVDGSLSISKTILQGLRSISINSEIITQRYAIFEDYSTSMRNSVSLLNKVAGQVNAEYLRGLILFFSEFQVQLQKRYQSLMHIFEFSKVNNSFQWWDRYFNLSVDESKLTEKKLFELSKILDNAVSSLNKVNYLESKVLSLLSLEPFSKSFRDDKMPNLEYFLELINNVQKNSKLNMLYNSNYVNNELFIDRADFDSSASVKNLSQYTRWRRQYDESCEKLKTYFDTIAMNEQVIDTLNKVDQLIYFEVKKYRKELGKLRENMNSVNILFTMITGYNSQYNSIIELIEHLMIGERHFEAYISNYLAMRNCMGDLNSDFSQLTSTVPSITGEIPEIQILMDSIKSKLLTSKNDLLKGFDESFNNQIIQSIESVFKTYLMAQIYFAGSLSQMLKSKKDPEMPFSSDDFNLLYNSIVRNESLLFKSKGIKPLILPENKLKERVSFLYSIFSSYIQQITNLKSYITQLNDNSIRGKSFHNGLTEFIKLLNSSLGAIKEKLFQMFEQGSLTKKVERVVLIGIEVFFLQLKLECEKLFDKLNILYESENLITRIAKGSSISLSERFIDRIKSISVLDNEPVEFEIEDKMASWDSHISSSNYPESIQLKKVKTKITHSNLDSGCTVAYLDRLESLKGPYDNTGVNIDEKYNVVVIHCIINNIPGETISDFLKRRANIKDSGSVVLPEYVAKHIDDEFYLHYLAVDFSLKNTVGTLHKLETQMNQLFILFPEFHIDYFLNLDIVIISGNKLMIDLNKDIIRIIFSSLVTYNSELNFDSACFFLYKSKVLVLEFPVDKNGKLTSIRAIGKYSGFGRETPVFLAVVDNYQEFQQDSSPLVKIQKELFQKDVSNYIPVYRNLAPLNNSHDSIREFAWIVSENSHLLYMLLLRSGIEKVRSTSEKIDLIYPVALEAQNELQIGLINAFVNSIAKRRNLNSQVFYDITKNKLFILNNSEQINTKSVEMSFSELTSEIQLFVNMNYFSTHILDIPIYESEMSQAIELYLSGSMPRFCSSRRNYLNNSIVLNINEHFSYRFMISYRLLISAIDPGIKLKVRNLPSQDALRKIFSFGKEFSLDFERLRFTYILPIMDINQAKISIIKKNMKLSLERMMMHTSYSQLEKFFLDIPSNSVRYNIAIPNTNKKSIIKNDEEIFQLNGRKYFVIRYSEDTVISALSIFVREILNGRINVIFAINGFDLKLLKPGDLPSDKDSIQIHLMKGVPIELVLNEHLVRIHAKNYEKENLQLVYDIMSIYQGFDLSIVTTDGEYYYFYLLCWDSNNRKPKHCSYIRVFRYLESNMFEKLKLYQISLNNNISFSAIAEEGEILSLDYIGLNVISRFGGSVLFKGDNYYELYYRSREYWDMCSFVQEFLKFSSDLHIKAINYDLRIKDVVFRPDFLECPIPKIPNLIQYNELPHFITLDNYHQESGFIFTLYNSIQYQILSVLINYFLSKKKLFIKHEGIEQVSAPKSILEILSYFKINLIKDSSVTFIFLNEISLKNTEIQSAKIVTNQIRSIIPNSEIIGINTRGERII